MNEPIKEVEISGLYDPDRKFLIFKYKMSQNKEFLLYITRAGKILYYINVSVSFKLINRLQLHPENINNYLKQVQFSHKYKRLY